MTSSPKPGLLPTALIVLGTVPVAAGAVRVNELAGGAEITENNARFFASPVPIVVHIVCASVFIFLGAFQFASRFRGQRPGWHRLAGRILVPSGIVAASAGIWMALFFPRPENVGDLLTVIRVVFGASWIVALVLGFAAVRRRDFVSHRAWMIRGYAVGMGAGTQVFTSLLWFAALGTPGEFGTAMVMLAGWLINIALAEWIIRGRRPSDAVRQSWQPKRACQVGTAR